ncbi:MAG TPA: undecaprenyl/decaprenyl-phosphate alpha-N-acetylglucosaminyl 1-phosphate transferase, partial [Candidatus Marinimicrobia bacterium]|nr:undecaprenyl/decaprenyl-phosphate alpha-N-acetylglucosaminyl 1-phosphate transferase [Candidatus Neomarinimicrobiota bacterium]
MLNIAIVFLAAFLISLSLTPVAWNVALRYGIVDHPSVRKVHLTSIPLLGGLAVYISFSLSVLFFFWNIDSTPSESWYQILGIVGGAAVLVAAGFLDDYGRLHS